MKFKINNQTYLWAIVLAIHVLFVLPYLLIASDKGTISENLAMTIFCWAPLIPIAMRILNRHVKTTVVVDEGIIRLWRIVLLRKIKIDNIIGLEYKEYWHSEYYGRRTTAEKRVKLIITIRDTNWTHKVSLNDKIPKSRNYGSWRYKMIVPASEEDIRLFQLYKLLSGLTGIE